MTGSLTELRVSCATVGESCKTTRSHVVLFRFFGTSHERSHSTKNGRSQQVGIRTSRFTDCVCLSVRLSICTQCSYLALCADWHCALISILAGPVAQHTDRSCIMLLAYMSAILQHTECHTSAYVKNKDTVRDNNWGASWPDTICR
jgi:hypothetical protein